MEIEEFSDEESTGLFSLLYRSEKTNFYEYNLKKLCNN